MLGNALNQGQLKQAQQRSAYDVVPEYGGNCALQPPVGLNSTLNDTMQLCVAVAQMTSSLENIFGLSVPMPAEADGKPVAPVPCEVLRQVNFRLGETRNMLERILLHVNS